MWAVENGITAGTSETSFSPNLECTRGQIAVFLWKASAVTFEEEQTSSAPSTIPHYDSVWVLLKDVVGINPEELDLTVYYKLFQIVYGYAFE